MLKVCERYAMENNISFSTDENLTKSKTKIVYMCGNMKSRAYPAPLKLNGRNLPFVPTAVHLGHTLAQDGTMDHDIKIRRCNYIDKTTEIRNTFSFAHPKQVLNAVTKNCGDHYGVLLNNLYEESVQKYFRCWGTCVKLAFSIPRSSHRYIVKSLLDTEFDSTRITTLSRYVNFYRSCLRSKCPELSLVATLAGQDKSSTTGINLMKIQNETGLNPWVATPSMTKEVLSANEDLTPQIDEWRIPYLQKLLEQRDAMEYQLEDTTELSELIDSLCSS